MPTPLSDQPSAKKKIFVKTYGCQMNAYDSSRMADIMAPEGYETTDSPDDADMVVLNTCHIREKASEKLYSDLGRVRAHKERREADGKATLIAVAGCVAQAEGDEIGRRAPYVDMVVGPQSYQRLPDIARRALSGERAMQAPDLDFAVEEKFDQLRTKPAPASLCAFVTVQEGCDKFCSFCVVPYTRGAEYSRPVADVLAEVRRLAEGGTVEVTLLGQNVNAYHGLAADGSSWSLAKLCYAVAEVPGIRRIRYTTSHPRDVTDDLIAAHAELPQLMPYLHLPVQSGSDAILARMNRKHTAAHYRDIIDRFCTARPDLALSTDIIVGFPGETEQDFADTMALVREVGFAQSYSFKYSIRPGTPAAAMEDQVPEAIKTERLAQLQALLNQQMKNFNQQMIGQKLDVLVEKAGRHTGQMVGRSPYLQAVHVDAPLLMLGEMVEVLITGTTTYGLIGSLVQQQGLAA